MPNELDRLINKIKRNPKLIRHIVFNPEAIPKIPKIGPELPKGEVSAETFLAYLGDPRDGYAIGHCGSGTQFLSAKGTQVQAGKGPGKKRARKAKRRRK